MSVTVDGPYRCIHWVDPTRSGLLGGLLRSGSVVVRIVFLVGRFGLSGCLSILPCVTNNL